jgi:glycosyltransferase involved in cell wall biosynthesis
MKKILWIYSGSLKHALDKASVLKSSYYLINHGWEVTIAASDMPNDADGRIRQMLISRPTIFGIGYLYFNIRLLIRLHTQYLHYDIILFDQLSMLPLLPIFIAKKIARIKRPRLIMDVRTMVMHEGSDIRGILWIMLFNIAQWIANKAVDGQTAITNKMARAVRIPGSKLLGVWPSGVDRDAYNNIYNIRKWPSISGPLIFIYIGVMLKERNLLTFCQGIKDERNSGRDVKLIIAGKGAQLQELKTLSKRDEYNNCLEIIDAVAPEEVPRLLARGHIGILPFPNKECFRVSSPIKMFEYMAAGLPILATRIDAHTDVLNNDFVFWAANESLSALSNAIKEAWTKKAELCSMGREAYKASVEWTWEKSSEKFALALEKALSI